MPALPFPSYPLSARYRFPYYQTREEFERLTLQVCPPWDESQPQKKWFDPAAAKSVKRNLVYDVVAYDDQGKPLEGPNGLPFVDNFPITKEAAAKVNIPPTGATFDYLLPPEVPVPLQQLDPDEELFIAPPGEVAIRNKTLWQQAREGFTGADRGVLNRMAQKLGVPLTCLFLLLSFASSLTAQQNTPTPATSPPTAEVFVLGGWWNPVQLDPLTLFIDKNTTPWTLKALLTPAPAKDEEVIEELKVGTDRVTVALKYNPASAPGVRVFLRGRRLPPSKVAIGDKLLILASELGAMPGDELIVEYRRPLP
jgi:hypothetical protein